MDPAEEVRFVRCANNNDRLSFVQLVGGSFQILHN